MQHRYNHSLALNYLTSSWAERQMGPKVTLHPSTNGAHRQMGPKVTFQRQMKPEVITDILAFLLNIVYLC